MSKKSVRTKTNKKSKKAFLFLDKTADVILNPFISLILGLCFVSAGGFLFFEAKLELKKLGIEISTFSKDRQLEPRQELLSFRKQGSLNNNFFDDAHHWIKVISDKKQQKVLPAKEQQTFLNWYTKTLIHLESERGEIKGYTSNETISKATQSLLLQEYDTSIKTLNELAVAILDWNKETISDRNSHLDVIIQEGSNLLATQKAWESHSKQAIQLINIEAQEAKITKDKILEEIKVQRFKTDLSFIGLILGALLVLFSILIKLKIHTKFLNPSTRKAAIRRQGRIF